MATTSGVGVDDTAVGANVGCSCGALVGGALVGVGGSGVGEAGTVVGVGGSGVLVGALVGVRVGTLWRSSL